ncbi:MAG: PorT family protein [Hymenobacteraceae bacterium]|nr:PorT family protein [Hymenobacteraceae bacterium]
MRKLLFSLALLTGFAGASHAQGVQFGVKVGASYTGLTGSDVTAGIYKPSYHGGVMADFPVSEVVSFHPEILYTLKKYDSDKDLLLRARDMTAIDVPLLARYHADGLFFEAGPQVSIPLTAINEAKQDKKAEFRPVSLEYAFGLGYQLDMGLSLGIRYNGSATPIYKKGGQYDLPGRQSNARNSIFMFSIGYAFGGTKS